MSHSIIDAILNIVQKPITRLDRQYRSGNRAQDAGTALEEYVKDLFAGTFDMDGRTRLEKISEVFSYLGNKSNPPDAMLRGGDAIEVKKIEKEDASLALNSSYPKHVLKSDSAMISRACRDAENWTEKDMLYVVGVVKQLKLYHLAFVYGLDYCATESCYAGIRQRIQDGVNAIEGVDFSETKELGRVNKVDPLGITYLRVRGMWGIENPWKVFDYVYQRDFSKQFNFMCLINSEKWNRLHGTERVLELARTNPHLKVLDIRIKDPDNPARLNEAKLVCFSI